MHFIENKGQIKNQNFNQRNDIQFSLKVAPELNIFIGSGSIHYKFGKQTSVSANADSTIQSATDFAGAYPTSEISDKNLYLQFQGQSKISS